MKKGLFNASFEESENLVDDKYIKKVFKGTNKKSMRKKLLGVFITGGLLLFFSSMSF